MLRLAVLVSGGGTNLQAILDAIDEGTITNAEVSVVISNNAGAYALERAKKKEIDAVCLSPKTFASREAFNSALFKPRMVSFFASSSPNTLIYTLHVFRSGATSAAVTEVIIPMRGSLISFRMMLESSFCTSPLILVFLILFFLNLIPHFYLGTSTMI